MSAYSEAANGFVVSDRVTLMLNTMNDDARMRILARAYSVFFNLGGSPLVEGREEQAAQAVAVCAKEISVSFKRRQKQSQSARQVGAMRAAEIVRPSHDNLTIPQERREEKGSPTPPIKEESKEVLLTPPKSPVEKREVFTPPTVEMVAAYCAERSNTVNAQDFVDFYTSKGWFIGKNKMKDWQAAVRTWERSRNGRTGFNGGVACTSNTSRARTTTAGNFRGGSETQRAEASVL